MTGASNYVLQVMSDDTDDDDTTNNAATKVALEIYFLDTSTVEEGPYPNASTHRKYIGCNSNWIVVVVVIHYCQLPAIAFQHIPTMSHLWNTNGEDDEDGKKNHCMGFHGIDVNYIEDDAGLVDIMIQSGRFQFLAVGFPFLMEEYLSYKTLSMRE